MCQSPASVLHWLHSSHIGKVVSSKCTNTRWWGCIWNLISDHCFYLFSLSFFICCSQEAYGVWPPVFRRRVLGSRPRPVSLLQILHPWTNVRGQVQSIRGVSPTCLKAHVVCCLQACSLKFKSRALLHVQICHCCGLFSRRCRSKMEWFRQHQQLGSNERWLKILIFHHCQVKVKSSFKSCIFNKWISHRKRARA